MRTYWTIIGTLALGLATSPAHAVGCFSGGVAGAVAGHVAHHGVLGAAGGCIAGHEYHKRQLKQEQLETQQKYQQGQQEYRQ
jgi:hypothetical protein